MSLWEILWRTYSVIDDYYTDNKVTVHEKVECIHNVDVFAELVLRFEYIHKEFLMEEWMYKID